MVAPPIDLAAHVTALRRITSSAGGARGLAELDVTADGKITEGDWEVFDALTRTAVEAARTRGVELSPKVFYKGPSASAPSVFSRLTDRGEPAADFDEAALRELAVESKWLAGQARAAAIAGGADLSRQVGGVLSAALQGYNPEVMEPAALCQAIEKLDVAPFKAAGLEPIMVTDLDSTVWLGNISDGFLGALVELKLPKPEANAPLQTYLSKLPGVDAAAVAENDVVANAKLLLARATATDIPKEQRVSAKDAFFQTVSLMKGLTVAEVETAARYAFEKGGGGMPAYGNRLFRDDGGCGMRKLLEVMKTRGVRVYFLSATLDVLAKAGGAALGIPAEQVLGSALEVVAGKYTGNVIESTYDLKGPISRQWLPGPPLMGFGDSAVSDFPFMLETIGAGFMVNPRQDLLDKDRDAAGGRFVTLTFDGIESQAAVSGR